MNTRFFDVLENARDKNIAAIAESVDIHFKRAG